MPEAVEYVRTDGTGSLRIGNTRVMLDSVLAAWAQGHSPESIRSQYPNLSLEEVYGAITWSLAHSEETQSYLKRQDEVWDYWRKRSESQGDSLRDRIRNAKLNAGHQR